MLFCNKCGAPVPDGSAFCTRCGQAVAAAHPAPPQYHAPGAPPPAQRVGTPLNLNLNLPPSLAAIFTPLGILPLAATVVCWICWFLLPGASVSLGYQQLSASSMSATFWQAPGFDPTNMTNMNVGNPGLVGVLVVICLLAPFAVPFIPNKMARFIYLAPLLAFIANLIAVEHVFSAFAKFLPTQYFSMVGVHAGTSLGVGAYLAGLASLGVAAGVVTSTMSPKPAGVGTPAAHHVHAPVAYAPAPPQPPARVAPPAVHAPAQPAGFCTRCGRPRAAGTQFCSGCGARFA